MTSMQSLNSTTELPIFIYFYFFMKPITHTGYYTCNSPLALAAGKRTPLLRSIASFLKSQPFRPVAMMQLVLLGWWSSLLELDLMLRRCPSDTLQWVAQIIGNLPISRNTRNRPTCRPRRESNPPNHYLAIRRRSFYHCAMGAAPLNWLLQKLQSPLLNKRSIQLVAILLQQ